MGDGPLGTGNNSPRIDSGTSARTTHTPRAPEGSDFFDEVLYYPVTATGAKIARKSLQYALGDPQGRYLLELWIGGTAAAEVTFASADWGDYMRKEPDLQAQIQHQLALDANALYAQLSSSGGRVEGEYHATFHGEVGRTSHTGVAISGGYFTGYQILHGSVKNATLNDVQIDGRFIAVRSPDSETAYRVTYSDLHFTWDDLIDVNRSYKMDGVLAKYARWEKDYTGGGAHPKDYAVHIKWTAAEPITIEVGKLAEFKNW
jgi:hypothetical protein